MALEQVGMRLVVEGLGSYVSGLKQAEQAQDKLGASTDQVTAKASKWDVAGAAVNRFSLLAGTAMLGVAAASTKMAVDFDTGMRRVNTVAKLPEAQFEALSEQVLALADRLGVTTTDILPGMYDALSAGVPADNVLSFMEIASKAAIGGITTTSIAADGLTTAINAFGLEADDTQRAADVMFKTVELGKTTFDQLATQLYDVAPAAAAANVTIEEVGAALAVLTASGTPTRVATTQVRQAILALSKPTEALNETFRAAGFTSGEAAIKERGLAVAMGVVRDAAGGSNAKLMELVGSVEAMQGILGLTGPKTDDMARALDAMKNSAGSTEAAFSEMEKSVARQWEHLKVTLQTFMIELGQKVLPMLETGIGFLKGIADAFGALPEPVRKVTEQVVLFVAAMTAATLAAKGFGFAVGSSALQGASLVGTLGFLAKGAGALSPLFSGVAIEMGAVVLAEKAIDEWGDDTTSSMERWSKASQEAALSLRGLSDEGDGLTIITKAMRGELDLALPSVEYLLADIEDLSRVVHDYEDMQASQILMTEEEIAAWDRAAAQLQQTQLALRLVTEQERKQREATEAAKTALENKTKALEGSTEGLSGYEIRMQEAGRIAALEFMPKIKDATAVIDGMRQAADETRERLIAMIEEPSEDELHAKYQFALAQDALAIFDAKHAGEELTEAQQAQRDELQLVIDKWSTTTRTYETARQALEAQFEWLDKVTENLRDQGDAAATMGFRVHNEAVPAVLDLTEALTDVPDSTEFDVSSPSLNRAVIDAHELLNTLRDISQQPPPPALRGMENPTPPGARSLQQIILALLTPLFPTDELLPTLRPPGGWEDFFLQQTPMLPEDRMPWLDELRRQRQRTRRQFEPPTEDELTLDEVTDPARILQIVQRAIDTITKISETDIPTLARPKIKRIADNMALILTEFSRAMDGIAPEAAHAAALVATVFEPIMRAIDASIDVLSNDTVGGFTGANMRGFRTVLANMAEVALIASRTLGTLDISKESAEAIANAGRAASQALRFLPDAVEVLGDPRISTYGGANMAGVRNLMDNLAEFTQIAIDRLSHFDLASVTNAADIMAQLGDMIRVLRQIVGSGDGGGGGVPIPGGEVPPAPVPSVPDPGAFSMLLPSLGQRFEGAPGGVSYTVNATYVNPQDPASIRIDLMQMMMQAAL